MDLILTKSQNIACTIKIVVHILKICFKNASGMKICAIQISIINYYGLNNLF